MTHHEVREKRIEMPWGQLAVHESGAGEALVLVHGFPMDHQMWADQIGIFPNWRVLAPDLRGLGKSLPTRQAQSMSDYTDDLAELLNRMELPTAVFAGLSMGGYILFEMMRRHSERVAALILVCTRAAPDTELAARGRQEAARRVAEVGTSLLAEQMPPKLLGLAASGTVRTRLKAMISHAPPAGVIASLDAMRVRADSTEILPKIEVPTLVLAGAEDQVVSVEEMQSFAADIPAARFHIIENAGHIPPMEQPDVFNDLIAAFLNDH